LLSTNKTFISEELEVLEVSMVHMVQTLLHAHSFVKLGILNFVLSFLIFFSLSQEPAAPTAGVEDAVEEEAEETTPKQAPSSPNLAVGVLEELMVKRCLSMHLRIMTSSNATTIT
jgi:hypothetical protein